MGCLLSGDSNSEMIDEEFYSWLENFTMQCKHCHETLSDPRQGTMHLKNYHIEAYNFWRAKVK
jgi:hypothetical protein